MNEDTPYPAEADIEHANDQPMLSPFARQVLKLVGIIVVVIVLWQIIDALLIAFAGILLAVFWRGLARQLRRIAPIPEGLSLLLVALLLVGLLGTGAWLFGPSIGSQINNLSDRLPRMFEELQQELSRYRWGQYIVDDMSLREAVLSPRHGVFSRITGFASSIMGFLTYAVLILFSGIYFAANPHVYRRGLIKLVPKPRRARFQQTLETTGDALWKWLVGQLVAMLFVGTLTAIGLTLIGLPMAMALGLIMGLLEFIPYLGPILAAVPGILLGLTISPTKALYALAVYVIVQQLESNLIVPLVMREAVSLPPVLVLLATVAMGLLFGILGIFVATPLLLVGMIMVKVLYVEDVLGDRTKVPGRRPA